MNPIAAEYVDKAEGDFATAQREVAATVNPNYDAVCFHAQQCAEKYLKARLQESGIMFGKTHDLTLLLNLALTVEPAWNAFLTDLQVCPLSRSHTVTPVIRQIWGMLKMQ